jgi:peptidoglycan hydrolase-like protein with peptidoglycan-binding domain
MPATTTTAAPAPTSTLAVAEPALAALGSTGPNVELVQRALLALDYAVGSPDGVWGKQTQDAWVAFETASQPPIVPDGVFTSAEASLIGGYASMYVAPEVPVETPAPAPPETEPEVTLPVAPPMTSSCKAAVYDHVFPTDMAITNSPKSHAKTDKYYAALVTFVGVCESSWPFFSKEATSWAEVLGMADDVLNCLDFLEYQGCATEVGVFKSKVVGWYP